MRCLSRAEVTTGVALTKADIEHWQLSVATAGASENSFVPSAFFRYPILGPSRQNTTAAKYASAVWQSGRLRGKYEHVTRRPGAGRQGQGCGRPFQYRGSG